MSPDGGGRETPRPPLGVGRILKEAVLIVRDRMGLIATLGLAPLMALEIFRYWLVPGEYTGTPNDGSLAAYLLSAFAFAIILPVSAVVNGWVTRMVYQVRNGEPPRLVAITAMPAGMVLTLVICDSAASVGILAGFILLILPGLYLLTIWLVLVPAIVLEDAGYQCFERSLALTAGYRWPCLAMVSLLVATDVGVQLALAELIDGLILSDDLVDKALYFLADAVVSLFFLALFATASTLTYLRLRDIREGTGWLADVFD